MLYCYLANSFFRKYVNHIGSRFFLLTRDKFLHHITFPHAPLARKYNQNAFSEEFLQFGVVMGS